MKKEKKTVWIKPNSNVVRCPVRLIEKYVNLLSCNGLKPNFILLVFNCPYGNKYIA